MTIKLVIPTYLMKKGLSKNTVEPKIIIQSSLGWCEGMVGREGLVLKQELAVDASLRFDDKGTLPLYGTLELSEANGTLG